jgi:predicted nucleic acid-binding protein
VVILELLLATPNATRFAEREADLSALREVPIDKTVWKAAVTAMRELSTGSDGYHKVPVPDVLIAAAAAERGLGVLHYDHDYDRLAEVINFTSQWVVPAGTAD